MTMVPLFFVDDATAALAFYTTVLDFALADGETSEDVVMRLVRDGDELMLTRLSMDQVPRVNAHLLVDDVDAVFARWTARGLDQSHHAASPVHRSPVDQTWGTRELYVTDPAGNTLRVVQRRG